MITITQGQVNTVYLSLKEKTTIDNPVYLFRFINEVTSQEKTCICADTSDYKYRYNLISIEENDTEDNVNGVVKLDTAGFWQYIVYQQTDNNLSINNTGKEVERGRVRVIGTAGSNVEYSPTETWTVYQS